MFRPHRFPFVQIASEGHIEFFHTVHQNVFLADQGEGLKSTLVVLTNFAQARLGRVLSRGNRKTNPGFLSAILSQPPTTQDGIMFHFMTQNH